MALDLSQVDFMAFLDLILLRLRSNLDLRVHLPYLVLLELKHLAFQLIQVTASIKE